MWNTCTYYSNFSSNVSINLVINFRVTIFFVFNSVYGLLFQYNKSCFNSIYGMCFFRVIEGYVWYNKSRLFSLFFMAKIMTFSFFFMKMTLQLHVRSSARYTKLKFQLGLANPRWNFNPGWKFQIFHIIDIFSNPG